MHERDLSRLEEPIRSRAHQALAALPVRADRLLDGPAPHRALGRLVRDAVIGEAYRADGSPADAPPVRPSGAAGPSAMTEAASAQRARIARAALERLAALQLPSGTFASGDNVDSPPDTAFTVNDLAWSAGVLRRGAAVRRDTEARRGAPADLAAGESAAGASLLPLGAAVLALRAPLEGLLERTVPALVTGGVHTPNHRFEIGAALARLGTLLDDARCTDRAEQWLAEGVDLQGDGLFSERSPNYAVHVTIPCLHVLAAELERPELADAADRALAAEARLTDSSGLVETLGSRRQDRRGPFDGGPLHPLLREHAARTGDPLSARAAHRTLARVDGDAALGVLALALEDARVLAPLPAPAPDPTPDAPEVHVFADSGLVVHDHGASRAVIHGGTDTALLGRISSGASDDPTFLRFAGRALRLSHLRLSRDFFSLGPVRFERPERCGEQWHLQETVAGEYFQPLAVADRRAGGDYPLEFNGRFAAAMGFSARERDEVALRTTAQVRIGAGRAEVTLRCEGPEVPLCLLLALEGGRLAGTRAVPAPAAGDDPHPVDAAALQVPGRDAAGIGRCRYVAASGEVLAIEVHGMGDGPAFYAPGEAYTVLGGTDLPDGDHLFVPASTAQELRLLLTLTSAA